MPELQGEILSPDMDDFLGYAHGDGAFAAWCSEVHELSEHLLGTSFFELEEMYDPEGYYCLEYSPRKYLRNVLIPAAACDYGEDWLSKVVADNILWGTGVVFPY